ncbi:hypothetical protein ACHOLT_11590 [Desulfitobacterium sp. Sab5]|uniref:hypothetical protein n=1 Tax=Desulfitobacterium nosdiversum TaxID=3375356 RepID=UPI003CF0A059
MFKRLFLVLISLIVMLSGCGISQTVIDWVDFVKLNDIQYLRNNYSIDANNLGSQIGEVKFRLSGNINDPNYKAKNGDAAFLEKGSPIYTVNGYKSSFRIAVRSSNNIVVYQVFNNPNAKIGADIADIFNKVEYIGISDETNDKEIVAIRDVTKINEMVDMLLKAPVNPSSRSERTGKRYFISYHLKDGSEFKGAYWSESGQYSNEFMLPADFGTLVKEALKDNG